MEAQRFNMYLNSISRLQAEEQIMRNAACDFPYMSEKVRSETNRKLFSMADSNVSKPKEISLEAFARIVAGGIK
jgi:hypothetical protein